jgi:GNAT superfamily N-acetyltransferase
MTTETTAGEIAITAATREDAPAIHAMLRALGASLGRADEIQSTPEHILRFGFGPSPAFETVIARQNGEPVGFAIFFYEFSTWRGCPGVYVQDLYVADTMRGTGLGRRLLAAVVTRAALRHARYMRLSVHAGNDDGMGFYERLGFTAPHEQTLVLEGGNFTAIGKLS